jgi:hypothetical protein
VAYKTFSSPVLFFCMPQGEEFWKIILLFYALLVKNQATAKIETEYLQWQRVRKNKFTKRNNYFKNQLRQHQLENLSLLLIFTSKCLW